MKRRDLIRLLTDENDPDGNYEVVVWNSNRFLAFKIDDVNLDENRRVNIEFFHLIDTD